MTSVQASSFVLMVLAFGLIIGVIAGCAPNTIDWKPPVIPQVDGQ